MLPKHKRIPRPLFTALRGRSVFVNGKFFSLRVFSVPNCTSGTARFSFVVSNKVSKKASTRNRIKRHGYETVAKIQKKAKPCHAYVFYCKMEPQGSFQEIAHDIEDLIAKTA